MKIRSRLILGFLGAGFLAVLAGSQVWAQVVSHARVVRLSFAEGTVSVERADALGWSAAPVNTPIQEGFKLATAEDSFAEVEFENTSTARLGQGSVLEFNQLALDASGGKLNRLALRQGYATFDVIPENGDVYAVQAGEATITLGAEQTTRFRADLEGGNIRIEVFRGSVEVASLFGEHHLGKNSVFEMRPGDQQAVNISHGITKDDWDEWVEDREKQAQTARRNSPPGLYTNDVTSLLYGWNDLYYYGGWTTINGFGNCWIPRVGYGWSPYSYGQWTWLPNAGYTWISSEPWGWMPFHYGGWQFQPGYGWFWVPTGGFGSWSPALVSWYQGPGWIGWRPLAPTRGGGGTTANRSAADCPQGHNCTTVVSSDAFRDGLPVRGHRINTVNVNQAFAVERPDVRPGELTRPIRGSRTGIEIVGAAPVASGLANASTAAGGASEPVNRVRAAEVPSGVRGGAHAPIRTGSGAALGVTNVPTQGSVVFDPAEGRFVNGHGGAPDALPKPSAQPAPSVTSAENAQAAPAARQPTGAVAVSPESVQVGNPNSPTPVMTHPIGPTGSFSSMDSAHHASPHTGVENQAPTGFTQRILRSIGFGDQGKQSTSSGTSPSAAGSSPWGTARSGGSSSQSSSGSFGGSRSSGGGSSGSSGSSAPSSGGGGSAGASHSAPSHSTGRPH